MNGGARPCENPTTNIAVLPSVYFFCTRHVPIPVEVGFLGRAAPRPAALRTTFCIARFLARSSSSDLLLSHSGLPANLSACPQAFSLLRSSLPTESSMNGTARPCAALRLFVSLASSLRSLRCFLYRSLPSSLHVLRPLCTPSLLAPKSSRGCPHLLPTESHMNGAARPFAALRLFVTLAS